MISGKKLWKERYKIERLIYSGSYEKAEAKNAALIISLKGESSLRQELAEAYLREARIKEYGKQRFVHVQESIDKALDVVLKWKNENSPEYCLLLAKQSELLINRHEIKKAEAVLKAGYMIAKNLPNNRKLLEQMDVYKAKVLMHQGNYAKALEALEPLALNYSQTVVFPSKLKGKQAKFEFLEKQRAYARFIMLEARVLIGQGHYSRADSILLRNQKWIMQNIGEKDIVNIENHLVYGECEARSENPYLMESRLNVATALLGSTKGYKYAKHSPVLVRALSFAVFFEYKRGQFRKGNDYKSQLESALKSGYGSNGPEQNRVLLAEAYKALQQSDIEKAKELLAEVGENQNWLHENKRYKLLYYGLLSKCNIAFSDYKKAYSNLQDRTKYALDHIYRESYPKAHRLKIDEAIHLLDYLHEHHEALKIFKYSFGKKLQRHLSPMHEDYVYITNKMAKNYEYIDDYQEAHRIQNYTINFVRQIFGEDSEKYSKALGSLAESNMHLGKFTDAKRQIETAIKIYHDHYKNERGLGEMYQTMAKYYTLEGDYRRAKGYLKRSQSILGKSSYDMEDLDDFAVIYLEQGEFRKTEQLLVNSILTKQETYGENSKELISSLNHLAELYLMTGDFTTADGFIRDAVELSIQFFADSSVRYADAMLIQGQIWRALGDYEKAFEAFEKVLIIQQKAYGGRSLKVAKTMQELALVNYRISGDYNKSRALLFRSLQIIEEGLGQLNPRYAEALKVIAQFYIRANKIQDAQKWLQKAKEILIRTEEIKGVAASGVTVAQIYEISGEINRHTKNFRDAVDDYETASDIYKKIFSEDHPEYVHSLSELAKIYHALGDDSKAQKYLSETTEKLETFMANYFSSLTEREKTKFWRRAQSDFEFYYNIAFEYHEDNNWLVENAFNMILSTKALLLNSSIKIRKSILASGNDELIERFNSLMEKKEYLIAVNSMSPQFVKDQGIEKDKLEREIRSLEKEMGEWSDVLTQQREAPDWKDVQSHLNEGEYAVEIVRFRHFTHEFTDSVVYAFMIVGPKTRKAPEVVIIPDGTKLEERHYKFYRNAVQFQLEDKNSFKEFWAPVYKVVGPGAKVFLSPDGIYNQVNLESFIMPQGGNLLDFNDIVILSNTKDIIHRKPHKAVDITKRTAMLVGNPQFYNDHLTDDMVRRPVPQLPGAETEVVELSSILKSKGWSFETHVGVNATENMVKGVSDPSPTIFHVATHGFFKEAPKSENKIGEESGEGEEIVHPLLRSGLMLKDAGNIMDEQEVSGYNRKPGVLTAFEAMNLNLEGTELVVLSACETGRGDIQVGEGVYGLQRAFLVAGAKSVIMSLFKVSDQITMKFMKEFYERWLSTGDRRLAFLEAKKQIRREHPESIYWGAFVMVGLP